MDSLNEKEYEVYKGNRLLQNSRINRNGLPAGTPAPVFRLPQLDGSEISLLEYRGRSLLLIFSDPGCGPCNQLAPQLEQLYRSLSTLHILVVSRGSLEANRAKVAEYGLTFPVVLQQRWEISREYAMFATPIAYLIDGHGIIASEVAVGLDAILGLVTEHEAGVRSQQEGHIMHDRLHTRLAALKKEFAIGQAHLQELEKQQTYLRETMLRISGAIQILEELLADEGSVEQNSAHLDQKRSVSDRLNLESDDHRLRQNSPAVDTLGEKE